MQFQQSNSNIFHMYMMYESSFFFFVCHWQFPCDSLKFSKALERHHKALPLKQNAHKITKHYLLIPKHLLLKKINIFIWLYFPFARSLSLSLNSEMRIVLFVYQCGIVQWLQRQRKITKKRHKRSHHFTLNMFLLGWLYIKLRL